MTVNIVMNGCTDGMNTMSPLDWGGVIIMKKYCDI